MHESTRYAQKPVSAFWIALVSPIRSKKVALLSTPKENAILLPVQEMGERERQEEDTQIL